MIKKILFLLITFSFALTAQEKKALNHNDYDQWQKIKNKQISRFGNFISYEITLQEGDGFLEIYNNKSEDKSIYNRGVKHHVSYNEKYLSFLVKPEFQKIRNEKLDKKKKLKLSQDSLKIVDLKTNKLVFELARVKEFKTPKEADNYIAYKKTPIKENKKDKYKTFEIGLLDIAKNDTLSVKYVTEYAFDKKGTKLFLLKQGVDSLVTSGVYSINLSNFKESVIDTSANLYTKLSVHNNSKYTCIASNDSLKAENKKHSLMLFSPKLTIIDSTVINKGWKISEFSKAKFSDNGKRIFFGLQKQTPFIEKDTTVLDSEKAQLDVWSWTDKQIQPEQKVKKKSNKEKSYLAVYHINESKFVQIENEKVEKVKFDNKRNLTNIIGYSNSDYKIARSYEYPWKRDLYSININTGEQKLIVKGIGDGAKLSPKGNYATYYSRKDSAWFNADLRDGHLYKLTKNTNKSKFYDDENDIPSLPSAVGTAYWSNDEEYLLINDKYDIWRIKPNGKGRAKSITNKFGAKNKIRFNCKMVKSKQEYLPSEKRFIITGFNEVNKNSGLYSVDLTRSTPVEIIEDSVSIYSLYSAKDSDNYIFTQESFYNSPNIYQLKGEKSKPVQISDTNPQQKNYKWGSVDLVSWKSYTDKKLDGLMYYPANFDPSKKYPVIVYFYELYSNSKNRYYSPSPSRSIVNFSYLTSNDYIVFVPDVRFTTGQPGQDSYDAVMAGVDMIEKYSFVDSENIAIQGQSWGGYQVAYLVTQTNRFKCAMAGAPVSNMTSAYGGIRWASGLSREFQYERTQSRIGTDLWKGFDKYVASSPVFMAPNVETPLLMMHNDNDGAVPYYQGIEYFMALRRLQKPVWLLVYNGESHNLKYRKNMRDLTVRMYQFFDYYLKGKPAPKWLINGVPYKDKGKDYGLELME